MQSKLITWDEPKPLHDLIAEAQRQQVDYLIAATELDPAIRDVTIATAPSTDLIVFRDSQSTSRWSGLSRCLPAHLYFLAAHPADHAAVSISVQALIANKNALAESSSLDELVVRLSAAVTTSFSDNVVQEPHHTFRYPGLIQADSECGRPWVRALIDQIPGAKERALSIAATALKAGLFLVNGCFEESHACSQSIEGLGSDRTGDYWHAILHRREPDYGNSKYWFRHVGRHPAFAELALVAERRLNETNGSLAMKLQSWKPKLMPRGSWDPFAFVDLCAVAENDPELRSWCEQLQYDEMILLLEQSSSN